MATRTTAVWAHRELLDQLVRRDLKKRYEQSFLGYGWTLLEPLLMTGIYWFVFTQVLRRSSHEDYLLFLVAGMLPWIWFTGCVNEGSSALLRQAKLVTSVRLDRKIFVFAPIGAKGVEYLATMPILVAVAIGSGAELRPASLPLLLVAVGLQLCFCLGVGLVLASATVLLRDIQRSMRVGLRALFYLSPVIFPPALVREHLPQLFPWYQLNPLVGLLELHRAVWFAGDLPNTFSLLSAVIGSVGTLVLGVLLFRALEPAVLKEL